MFSLVAITLASVGLYGVLAQAVAQRGRELGVRMALGASAREVVGMVVKQAARLGALGTFAAVGSGLFLLALLASVIPARRATRVDPMEALRTE